MGVARNQDAKIVMNGWAGLNESLSPAHLRPGDLAAVSNMDLRDGIALASRRGQTSEHDRIFYPNNQPVRRMLHYKSLSGVKRRLVLFGNNLRVASNSALDQYRDVVTIPGTPWMFQYYDIILFGSDQSDMGVYDPIADAVSYPNVISKIGPFVINAVTGNNTGGYLGDGYYAYRYTYDISVAGILLGETGPLWFRDGSGNRKFVSAIVHYSSGGNINSTTFESVGATNPNTLNMAPYVSAINVYRSPTLSASPLTTDTAWEAKDDFTLEWCGSISMDDVRASTLGQTVFTDAGTVYGKPIRRRPLDYAPRSKRVTMHKGRLWMSSTYTRQNDTTTYDYAPDLVAFSENGENGTEPFVFFPESTLAVGAGEPNEITVCKSLRNQALAILKEDKTYAVLGGDTELVPGVPDLSPQLIDGNSGCDAPDSAVEVDGGAIMFKSERGVMLWDGASPRAVAYERIKKTFNRIVGSRRHNAVGAYNPKEREYTLFSTLDHDGGYNRSYIKVNMTNGAWVAGALQRGVSAALWVNDADAEGYMLWGIDDVPLATYVSTPWVMRADSGNKEGIDANTGHTERISFSADLGYQDAGAPWLRKRWTEIAVEYEGQVPLSLAVWIDNKGPSTQIDLSAPTDEETLTWGIAGNAWGEKKWAKSSFGTSRRVLTRSLDTLPVGNSIRCILSGTNVYGPLKIYSVTVFYAPEES